MTELRRRRRPKAFYRCPHRPSHRVPAPAIGAPNRERCTDCGALIAYDWDGAA